MKMLSIKNLMYKFNKILKIIVFVGYQFLITKQQNVYNFDNVLMLIHIILRRIFFLFFIKY